MLFWLIFLPGVSFPNAAFDSFDFDRLEELSRVFLYDLPALALVLFLSYRSLKPDPFTRPKRTDLLPAALAFLCLALISSALGYAESFYPGDAYGADPMELAPMDWLLVFVSCVSTGYLEESYFRAYLLTRFDESGVDPKTAMLVSVALFALCHLYEGVWGVLNSAFAGIALAFFFKKTKTVHAAAWAHAAYNMFAYASY